MTSTLLFWHRRDLRLSDNVGLAQATQRSLKTIGVFCLDPGILERDDAFAKAYLLIGHCYHRRGEYGTAKDFQRQAQRLDPSLKY